DHRPAVLSHPGTDNLLSPDDRCEGIHLERLTSRSDVEIEEVPIDRVHSRIVDEHVDAAELLQSASYHLVLAIRIVRPTDDSNSAASAAQNVNGRFEALRLASGDADTRAFCDQAFSDSPTDSAT